MSGAVEVNFSELIDGMAAIAGRIADPAPFLAIVGTEQALAAKERIKDTKVDPWLGKWEPWAESTAQHREKKGNASRGLLWDEGDLLASIRFETTSHEVTIGSDLEYAEYLQDGTPKMPARPFLGWSQDTLSGYEVMAALFFIDGII